MRKRREHYIFVSYAEEDPWAVAFSALARTSKDEFLSKVVTNAYPPPEREVVLVVAVSDYDKILESSLEKVYGFLFESGILMHDRQLKPEFMVGLRGLLGRLVRDNQNIKHYGISVAAYISEGSIEELKSIYGVLQDLCSAASKDVDVDVDFEIVQTPEALRVFLQNELFKIAHGDIKAQLAGLVR
jgi:hypothetical protein